MPLKTHGVIAIPSGLNSELDHAAFDPKTRRVFIAHTARDCLEVIDHDAQSHVATLPGFPGVAGAVADEGEISRDQPRGRDDHVAGRCPRRSLRKRLAPRTRARTHVASRIAAMVPRQSTDPSELFASSRMRAYNRRGLYLSASTSTKNAGDDCRRLG